LFKKLRNVEEWIIQICFESALFRIGFLVFSDFGVTLPPFESPEALLRELPPV
jgi:hypothetical protein